MDLVKLVTPTGAVVKVSGDRVEKFLRLGYELADKPKRRGRPRKKAADKDE